LFGKKQKLILKNPLILFCANTCRFRFEHISHKRNAEKNLIDCLDDKYHRNVVFSIYAHRKALQ